MDLAFTIAQLLVVGRAVKDASSILTLLKPLYENVLNLIRLPYNKLLH